MDGPEFSRRERLWKGQIEAIEDLNEMPQKTKKRMYKAGDNQFSDWDNDEIAIIFGLDTNPGSYLNIERAEEDEETHGRRLDRFTGGLFDYKTIKDYTNGDDENAKKLLSTPINWAETEHMIPVKDQGACGACWSFSATSALEGVTSIMRTKANGGELVPPVRLSEQMGLDCTKGDCKKGGWMYYAWEYGKIRGFNSYEDYPFTGSDNDSCKNLESTPDVKVKGYYTVGENGW